MSQPWSPGGASAHHKRIAAVFAGEVPDRFPICEQSIASSVASAIMGRPMDTGSTALHYAEACAWDRGDAAHDEFVEKVYRDAVDMRRALDFDILHLPWRMRTRPTRRIDANRFLYGDPAGDWVVYAFDPASQTYGPESAADISPSFEKVSETMRAALAQPLDLAGWRQIDPTLVRATREMGAEIVVSGSGGMSVPMQPGWLEATVLDPGLLAAWLDRTLEGVLASLSAQREAGIRLVNGGGDFAHNGGPAYSPAFFEAVMAPRWKRMFDHCHALGMKYVFRSDGNLWPVAGPLFEWARPDAYYEIDHDAGMTFDRLRARFPELVLFGNVSCSVLRCGTAGQVREAITRCLAAAAPRVVAASANSILHGTPPENVLALYETARAWRPAGGCYG